MAANLYHHQQTSQVLKTCEVLSVELIDNAQPGGPMGGQNAAIRAYFFVSGK